MDLNLDALANAIIEEYKQRTGDKKLVEDFIASVGEKGTYSEVYALAKKAGLNLEQAIINQWTFEADEVYYGTLKSLLQKTTGPMHDDIASACQYIQDNMNKAAGIKLKSQLAAVNDYDLGDIADRMKNQGITKLSGELQTLGCKMVDDNQQANMDLQTSVGYEIVVSRKYDSIGLRSGTKYAERCKLCVGLEGSHQFKSTREARNSGVFKRHPGCGCVIDYYSKRTGTVSRNIQNYNTGKKTKDKKQTRNEEVKKNIAMLEKIQKRGIIKVNLQYFSKMVEEDIKNQDSRSLKKAIRKYQKEIMLHEEKIKHPEKYCDDWATKRQEAKDGLIRHWQKENRTFTDCIDRRIAELKKRGDYDE